MIGVTVAMMCGLFVVCWLWTCVVVGSVGVVVPMIREQHVSWIGIVLYVVCCYVGMLSARIEVDHSRGERE